jgi:hypothetical protein
VSHLLDGAWQKLEWAKGHAQKLRDAIREAGDGDMDPITLRREYVSDERAVVYRIKRVIEIGEDWPLITGDALHNFRCALDYAWWQAARKNLGRTPTEDEAKRIQFPILKPGGTWDARNHIPLVGKDAAKLAGRVQPDYSGYPKVLHPLGVLNELSNKDKHRFPHLAVTAVESVEATNMLDAGLTDCVSDPRSTPGGMADIEIDADNWNSPDHVVMRVFVRPTGPNPDADLKAKITSYIAIEGHWNLLEVLDRLGSAISDVLQHMGPFV